MILADGALGQMMEPVDFEAKPARVIPEKDWACCGHGGKRVHNIVNSLYIEPDQLEKIVMERFERYKKLEENEVKYEEYLTEDADIVLVAYGITARIAKTAVRNARKKGIKAGLFRPITLYPFPKKELNALADKAKCFLSVEMNMGQMVNDIKLAINCKKDVYHYGRTGGMIPSPEEILAKIEEISGGNA
jgi:2-oxoglutarate ferredoxin oxidoreductase subunit alpha